MSGKLDWNPSSMRGSRADQIGPGHQHFETSRRRAILGFEYHANVVSILF
jgi:hypothetical protein